MTTRHTRGELVILRQRLRADVAGLALVWLLFLGGVAAVGIALATFGTVRHSLWEQAAQLPRWFALGTGVYFTAVYLPLYIAHGYSRAEFFRQLPVLVAAHSVGVSALLTLGFAVERVVYDLVGWEQALVQSHLYASADEYLLIFAEFLLIFPVWTLVGVYVAAGFYRRGSIGTLLVPLGLLSLMVIEMLTGAGAMGPLPVIGLALDPDAGGAVFAALALVTTGLAVTWAVIRDVPLRSRRP